VGTLCAAAAAGASTIRQRRPAQSRSPRTESEVASPERQHLAIFSGVDRLAPMPAGAALRRQGLEPRREPSPALAAAGKGRSLSEVLRDHC
jgi:hypothetical protein